jgi:hypothetical protein
MRDIFPFPTGALNYLGAHVLDRGQASFALDPTRLTADYAIRGTVGELPIPCQLAKIDAPAEASIEAHQRDPRYLRRFRRQRAAQEEPCPALPARSRRSQLPPHSHSR